MRSILVRDVPDDLHATLQQRAQRCGQSLQQYLISELHRLADRPTLEEVLFDIATRQGGRIGLAQAVDDLREDRDR